MEKSQPTDFNEDTTNESASVACSNVRCESWTPRKNEETYFDTSEMKGLRKILWVSWRAKKTNEWVPNKAGVKRELLDTVKARKLSYYGHTMRKQGSYLKKDIMQGKCQMCAGEEDHACTAWMDTSRRGQDSPSIRMTEDREKWRKYIHGVASPRIQDG